MLLAQNLDVSSQPNIVVKASSTLLLSSDSNATVSINGIDYVGQGETLYIWAGISRGSKVLYETRQHNNVLMYPVVLPSVSKLTNMIVNIDLVLTPVNPQPGTADAIIIVSHRKSLARPNWRLRAMWLDQFLIF